MGDNVGDSVGASVVGADVGDLVGDKVGLSVVGANVGDIVGESVVGDNVGDIVGDDVGASVGAFVAGHPKPKLVMSNSQQCCLNLYPERQTLSSPLDVSEPGILMISRVAGVHVGLLLRSTLTNVIPTKEG